MMTIAHPHARRAFGERLKNERERRGTSLAAISDVTKVNPSLLEALERGDASRWPKGIYRRAFFKDYLVAIGLPAEPYVTEFLELFPDGEERPAAVASPPVLPAPAGANGPGLRLTFGDSAPARLMTHRPTPAPAERRGGTVMPRVAATALDLVMIAALAGAVAAGLDRGFWSAAGIVALVYYPVSLLVFGHSAGCALLSRYAPSLDAAWDGGSWRLGLDGWRGLVPNGPAMRTTGAALRSYLMETSRFFRVREDRTQRDLAEVRRRRIEQANRNSDKVEAIS